MGEQATARSESTDSQVSAASAPPGPVPGIGGMLEMPQTSTFENCMALHHYSYQQYLLQMGTHVATAPGCLHDNRSSQLTLDLGVGNGADPGNMPLELETPTLDRHVPAMHVSCRASDTPVIAEQSCDQPIVRSWLAGEPTDLSMTLAPELACMSDLCTVMAPELTMQDMPDFCTAPLMPMAPELNMKVPDVNDLCGVPLEAPTLDRAHAPTVAIRGDRDVLREGLKLSLADYLL